MCFAISSNTESPVDRAERMAEEAARRAASEEAARLARLSAPAPNPFAVFGPRLGVESVSNVLSGEQGARVSVSDVKAGIDRSVFSRPSSTTSPSSTEKTKINRPSSGPQPGSFGGDLI